MRAREGSPVRLPYRVQRHQVAVRYGMTPEAVDDWPADDFLDALNFLEVTGV